MEGEEYYRVSGDVVCVTCGVEYWRHPRERYFTEMGEEVFFVRLCSGKLGKL